MCSLLQLAFTEEGLNRLWNELVKDNEIISEVPPISSGVSASFNESDRGREDRQSRDEEEDGEKGQENIREEQDKEKRSGFMPILEEWTWGEVSHDEEHVISEIMLLIVVSEMVSSLCRIVGT